MKISLIVPAFNEEKYIGKLLDSVLIQSRIPDEVIICDNNSTDNIVQIVKKYQKSLPIKIFKETQKGIRFAVETAWRNSTGELILRTDADCILPKDWVIKYENIFINDPNLSACGGGSRAADGNQLYKILTPVFARLNGIFLRLVKGHLVLFGGNFAIRRTALIKIDGYASPKNIIQDDFYICQKLSNQKLKTKYISNQWNYTSVRRFYTPNNIIKTFLSVFNQNLYIEKST